MIKDRPEHLLADDRYRSPPKPPYELDWSTVPELVRVSIFDLFGIQPVTGLMASAAGGMLTQRPSKAEIELFSEKGTKFQAISIVASLVAVGSTKDGFAVAPFSLSLIPASKRGIVDTRSIEFVAAIAGGENLASFESCYVGYDPFSGDWELYGPLGLLGSADGFLDELGLVVDTYFLATDFDPADVLMMKSAMPSEELERKYRKKRCDLLFRPFERVEARRIWGAESPIELFVIQELARQGLHPAIQMLIMDDGTIFPSWYPLAGPRV